MAPPAPRFPRFTAAMAAARAANAPHLGLYRAPSADDASPALAPPPPRRTLVRWLKIGSYALLFTLLLSTVLA
jgi:hypothetical protein